MRLIVSKLHQAGNFGGDKLIKYYRCLFQAALYRDNDAAFQVLEEVKQMIQSGLSSEVRRRLLNSCFSYRRWRSGGKPLLTSYDQTTTSWPEDELQFLAVISFNEGIDWFAGGREDQARLWVLSAASLAHQCHDGGKLKALINARFGLLNIGDLELKQSVESDIHDVAVGDTALANDPVLLEAEFQSWRD